MKNIILPLKLKNVSDLKKYLRFQDKFDFSGTLTTAGRKFSSRDLLENVSEFDGNTVTLKMNIYDPDEIKLMLRYLEKQDLLIHRKQKGW